MDIGYCKMILDHSKRKMDDKRWKMENEKSGDLIKNKIVTKNMNEKNIGKKNGLYGLKLTQIF